MIKAVIFDKDGLIIDSEPIHSKAFEVVLRSYGKVPKLFPNGLVHIVGLRGDQSWKLLKEKYDIKENIEVLRKKQRENYSKLLKSKMTLMPGVLSILKLIKVKKLKTAIASSSIRKHILHVINTLNLSTYFDVIVSGQDVVQSKPDPQIFLVTAEKLGLKVSNCLVFEDSETGVQAAKRAGMKVIAVPTKHTRNHDFSRADMIINSLEEMDWGIISSF